MVDLRSQLCVDDLHFWVCPWTQALGLYNHLSVLRLAVVLDHFFSTHFSSGGERAALIMRAVELYDSYHPIMGTLTATSL